jgi:hypothetical protein
LIGDNPVHPTEARRVRGSVSALFISLKQNNANLASYYRIYNALNLGLFPGKLGECQRREHQRMRRAKRTVGPTVRKRPTVAIPTRVPIVKSVSVMRLPPRPYLISR